MEMLLRTVPLCGLLFIHVLLQPPLLAFSDHSEQYAVCQELCHCLHDVTWIRCIHLGLSVLPQMPQTARTLELDHNRINLVHNSSFRGLSQLEVLSLQNNGIRYMESGAFVNLPLLRILRLSGNHLHTLPRNIFWNNRHLQILDFSDNVFTGIPDYVMYHLGSLNLLNISYNHLTSPMLGPGFQYTTQLSSLDLTHNNFIILESHVFQATLWWDENVTHYLNLSYCNIRHIHTNALSKLFRLESLSLEGNDEIPTDDLKLALRDLEVSSLRTLNLSKMNITDIFDFFRRFQHRNLRELNLSHNSIQQIKKRTFYYLTNLKVLDLSHNRLRSIGDLNGLSRLESLILSYNQIAQIESVSFEGLQQLTTLDLSHNQLSTITDEPFQNLWDLKSLDITCNQLSRFTISTGLENLQSLRVSSNKLSSLNSIKRLLRLTYLDISQNTVTKVGPDIFSRGQNLLYVNFSGNSIQDIHTHAFQTSSQVILDLSYNKLTRLDGYGWRRLKQLYLQGNAIQNVSVATFRGLNTLSELYLQHNNLHSFPEGSFVDLYNLQKLSLSFNPLGPYLEKQSSVKMLNTLHKLDWLAVSSAGLETLPFSMFTNLTELQHLDLGGNRLRSLTQDSFHNLTKLSFLNISSNNISLLDPATFSKLKNLHLLDLTSNPFECTCDLMPFRNWLTMTNVKLPHLYEGHFYHCETPPEWKNIALIKFHLESDKCTHSERAVIFAAIGCILLAILFSIGIAVYRYKWWVKRKLTQAQYSVIDDTSSVQSMQQRRDWV